MKTASFNCCGIGKKNLKRKTIFKECMKYDTTCLQETYITDDKRKLSEFKWVGVFFIMYRVLKILMIILTIQKMGEGSVQTIIRKERVLCLKMTFSELCFYIINLYGPNSRKEKNIFQRYVFTI